MKFVILIAYIVIQVQCQVPSFGGCPGYDPMGNFNPEKFLGTWYEVERLFTVTELASRCVSATYERKVDGQLWVDNYFTNRFTGVQRKISGVMNVTGTSGRAQYNIKYNSLPLSYDTNLAVLDTDYNNYAVIYSCSSLGPIANTQSVWVMTRERLPPGTVLQSAYGVLDKFKISRSFFIKTDQENCDTRPKPTEADNGPSTEQLPVKVNGTNYIIVN